MCLSFDTSPFFMQLFLFSGKYFLSLQTEINKT